MILRYNLFTILWAIVILILTLTPGKYMPHPSFMQFSLDKLAHFIIFLILAFLMIRGLRKQYTSFFIRVNAVQISLLFGIFYGIMIEVLQAYIPGRFFEWDDAIADGVGALGGWFLIGIVNKPWNK